MPTNRTKSKDYAYKKVVSASAAVIDAEDFDGTEAIQLFQIPENCIVTHCRAVVKTAGNTGRTFDVNLGSTLVLDNIAADNAATRVVAETNIDTGTGEIVTVTPSAAITGGQFVVTVEYIEYTLKTVDFTEVI